MVYAHVLTAKQQDCKSRAHLCGPIDQWHHDHLQQVCWFSCGVFPVTTKIFSHTKCKREHQEGISIVHFGHLIHHSSDLRVHCHWIARCMTFYDHHLMGYVPIYFSCVHHDTFNATQTKPAPRRSLGHPIHKPLRIIGEYADTMGSPKQWRYIAPVWARRWHGFQLWWWLAMCTEGIKKKSHEIPKSGGLRNWAFPQLITRSNLFLTGTGKGSTFSQVEVFFKWRRSPSYPFPSLLQSVFHFHGQWIRQRLASDPWKVRMPSTLAPDKNGPSSQCLVKID